MQDCPHFAAQHNVTKGNAVNSDFFSFFFGSRKPVPPTRSELVNNRLPIKEGKQISQESLTTSKWPRSNQAPVKNIDCHRGTKARGYQK